MKEIVFDGSQKIDCGKIGPNDRIKFIIPIGEKKKWWKFWEKSASDKAKQSLGKLISNYKEEINLNSDGTIDYFIPVNKE